MFYFQNFMLLARLYLKFLRGSFHFEPITIYIELLELTYDYHVTQIIHCMPIAYW